MFQVSSWGGGNILIHPPLLQGMIYQRKYLKTQLNLKGLILLEIEPCPIFLYPNNGGVKSVIRSKLSNNPHATTLQHIPACTQDALYL